MIMLYLSRRHDVCSSSGLYWATLRERCKTGELGRPPVPPEKSSTENEEKAVCKPGEGETSRE